MSRRDEFTTEYHAAPTGKTITTLRLDLRNGESRYYATEEIEIDGELYLEKLIEAEDIEESEESSVDTMGVTVLNTDKIIGLEIKAGIIHFAEASLGKYFIKPSGESGWRETFFGVAIPQSSNEREAKIEIVDEMVAAGYCVANWTLVPVCQLIYKSLECGSTAPHLTCNKLLKGDCTRDENTHRNVSETFPLVKNETAPTAPSDTELGNASGGNYGGGYSGGWWKQDQLIEVMY